jgi:hypothetical protein
VTARYLDDLEQIKAELNANPASALQWLFPAGRLVRNEFRVGNIDGTPGKGLAFNVRKLTGKDFKSGAKGFGSVLDVFVAHAGSFLDGLELARKYLGIPEPERPQPQKGTAKACKGNSDDWTEIIPPPPDAGRPQFARLWPSATFRQAWEYRDTAGCLLFYVARYEREETGKDGERKVRKVTPAVTWGHGEDDRQHWRAKGRALDIFFGLDQLGARPHAPVLIVEGEKAAEIARQIFPDWVVLAWKGGSGNAGNIDVDPLAGRSVVLWPDADDAGDGAMKAIGRSALKVGADVRLVALPPELAALKDGWDLADARDDRIGVPAGWTEATLAELLADAETIRLALDPAVDEAIATPQRPKGLLDCAAYFPADRLDPEIIGPELRQAIARFLDDASVALRFKRDYDKAYVAAEEMARSEANRQTGAILDEAGRDVADEEDEKAFYQAAVRRAGLRIRRDTFADGTPDPAERIENVLYRRMRQQFVSEAKAAVCARYEFDAPIVAPRLQIKASAGIGKTSIMADELAKRPELTTEFHIHFYAPNHRFLSDVVPKLPHARIMYGRSHPMRTGTPMCQRHQAADRIARAGLPVFENICKREDGACPHFKSCAWIQQWQDHEPGVRLFPLAYLNKPKALGLPEPDLVIIDESAVSALVGRPTEMSPCLLTQDRVSSRVARDRAQHTEILDTAERTAKAIRAIGLELKIAREQGLTVQNLREAAKAEDEEAKERLPKIGPCLDDNEIIRRVDAFEKSEGSKVARLYRALADELDLERDQAHGVQFKTVPVEVQQGEDLVTERLDRVFVHSVRRPRISPDAGLLLLDADANIEINRRLFGERLEAVNIRVRRNAEVIQVTSTRLSKFRLLADTPDAIRKLDQIRKLADREAAEGRQVLIVTYKRVRCLLTGEDPTEDLSPCGQCGAASVIHFGALRGIDRYKDFDTVIVAGRQQQPPYAVEATARALFATDPEPLRWLEPDEAGDVRWSTEERGYTMKDGSRAGVEIERHPDDRVQRVLELTREAETAQAMDRLRLIHRTTPARVYLLSNLPVDAEVDRLVTLSDLMRGPCRLEQAASRGLAVPLSASELARCFPDLWRTPKAAECDLNTLKTPIESLLGKGGYLKSSYRRAGQRGRPTPALIRSDALDPRAALEAVVGPVVWVEVELPCDTSATVPIEVADAPPVITPAEPAPPSAVSPVTYLQPPLEDAAPRPPPAEPMLEDINRVQRVVSSVGRLAGLSARLDYARPPHRWGDFTDALRERDWRARMAALCEMTADGWSRRSAVNV